MATFWRLLGFLRPHRGGVIASFALAGFAMAAGVLIPFLVGVTVDEIRKGGTDLWPLALAVVGAGVLRVVFSVLRRLVAGKVSLGVEYDLRNRMYQHLHSLELGFFDSQQTGQLMSRATVDLQAVRFFLGYGLIFILQSALTILIAATVMFVLDPKLAARWQAALENTLDVPHTAFVHRGLFRGGGRTPVPIAVTVCLLSLSRFFMPYEGFRFFRDLLLWGMTLFTAYSGWAYFARAMRALRDQRAAA